MLGKQVISLDSNILQQKHLSLNICKWFIIENGEKNKKKNKRKRNVIVEQIACKYLSNLMNIEF